MMMMISDNDDNDDDDDVSWPGVRYTDQRLTSDQFSGVRDRLPYGQLPVAKIDGVNISQSMAIARYKWQ